MAKRSLVVIGARIALGVTAALLLTLMLGPFQGAEAAFGLTDKEAHVLAFFALTALSFLSGPQLRRNDIAMTIAALGAASEIAQIIVGRDGSVDDGLADCAGVALAWLPAYFEALRRFAREGAQHAGSRRGSLRRRRSAMGGSPHAGPARRSAVESSFKI